MTHSSSSGVGRARYAAGVVALAVGLAMAGPVTHLAAQQPPPAKPAAPKAPAAQKGAAQQPAAAQSSWVKVCQPVATGTMFMDGKPQDKLSNLCMTQHERLDGNTGLPIVSAAFRQVEGQDKQFFMVVVPLGMIIDAGIRVALYPKDAWEQAQKNEKFDESKLKGLKLDYTLCQLNGCAAEAEAPPELINDLRTLGGMVVFSINANRTPAGFPVSLAGFDKAFNGPPVDAKQYAEGRQALMQQIAQRQRELAEQQKKQPAATPAPAQPAPKK